MTDSAKHLRIAWYGYADRRAASVAAGGFVLLQELLRRGHEVDFFGRSSFVRPRELESERGFRFVEVPASSSERLAARAARLAGRIGGQLAAHAVGQLANRPFARGILRAMRRAHAADPYDVQFWFGTWAWGHVSQLPVVSWVQGPPETDTRSIQQRRKEVIDLCGWRMYSALRTYAAYRASIGLPSFRHTDLFIVGSRWSKQRLAAYGIDPARIDTLPYPIDLERFGPGAPSVEDPAGAAPLILWLGRIVPRKRLDLFLDACAKLLAAGRDVRVAVVGPTGFAPAYTRLIERFPFPQQLKYLPWLERDEVVPLIRSARVVVQPSEDENFGSAIGEALACGVPVVLGPTNGTADYVGQGAVHFQTYDADSVAEAIGRLLDSEVPGAADARRAAETFLSPGDIASQLEAILRRGARLRKPAPRLNQAMIAGVGSLE